MGPGRDRHAPLSHIRVSLTTCIGAGHIIFLAGMDATENKVTRMFQLSSSQLCALNHSDLSYSTSFSAGSLCRSSSSYAVLSDGIFLLDVNRGNLPLPVCCQGLQHRRQNLCLSRDFLG